jgi:Mn2+/Fe2+ NRAMP family transporter
MGANVLTEKKDRSGMLSGAAFLMAVSAIGPGFLTQTTQFTVELGASLAFAILISIVIDIGAQLNTWRVICISKRRGQDVAGAVVPGLGWIVSAVIVFGSFVFNVGNLSGCALGLQSLFGLNQGLGATLSALLAVGLFLRPRMLEGVDWFSKLLGAGMVLMTFYVVVITAPPLGEAARQAVWPERVDFAAIVTLVGGTIGGYIMFSGAHRLLDGGVGGVEQVGLISKASIRGILITGLMRTVLFLAVLGVVKTGAAISPDAPVFDAFRAGAGPVGFVLSGLVFWSAAITSVVGCSYTSISFVRRGAHERTQSWLIVGFIVLSLAVTLSLKSLGWRPTPLLIAAGTLNGVLIPVVLGVVLVAAYRRSLMGEYRHPWWAGAFGVLAWVITLFMAYRTLASVFK